MFHNTFKLICNDVNVNWSKQVRSNIVVFGTLNEKVFLIFNMSTIAQAASSLFKTNNWSYIASKLNSKGEGTTTESS